MEGPRPVKPEEIDSLFDLVNTVFSGHKGGMRDGFPLLFDSRNWQNLFVMTDGARVVSHLGMRLDEAVVLGCRLKIASVGAVATYEEYRGKGLATRCLEAAEAKAISEGASVTLISGSRGLYRRLGAVKVGRSFVYGFARGECAGGIRIQEAAAGDVFTLGRLYEHEPVRFHRPLEDWHAVFGPIMAKRPAPFRDRVYLFGNENSPTGYTVARYGSWGEKPFCFVMEYAGDRGHLVGALPAIAESIGSEPLDLAVPDYDQALRRAAAATGIEPRADYLLHHTAKVSSLPSFIRSMKPLIEQRLGRTGAGGLAFQPSAGGYDIIVGEEHTTFSVPAFTVLVFGSPERDAVGDAQLGEGLLGRLFPIPLPLPGLNYV